MEKKSNGKRFDIIGTVWRILKFYTIPSRKLHVSRFTLIGEVFDGGEPALGETRLLYICKNVEVEGVAVQCTAYGPIAREIQEYGVGTRLRVAGNQREGGRIVYVNEAEYINKPKPFRQYIAEEYGSYSRYQKLLRVREARHALKSQQIYHAQQSERGASGEGDSEELLCAVETELSEVSAPRKNILHPKRSKT